jgi:hypothetical protein
MKVLDLAAEGAEALYMLTGECRWEDSVVHPETSYEATRAVVEELTRAGHVEICAIRADRTDPTLDLDEALAAIADERNWQWPGPEGAETIYDLDITESGDAEYWRLRRAAESSSAT